MTTFARLALVIQGKIPPCNWIERAFNTVINALKLPTVGTSDKGKYLHTNESTGALEWAEAGGSDLPSVTAEDDGKVLAVVSGAWAAAEISDLISSASGVSF